MTAKRFTLFEDLDILDNNTGRIIPPCLDKGLSELVDLLNQLNEENDQLKERNQRQAKRLAELYELMAKKDWEALTEIIDEFCSFEEQLQKEWKCYE